MIKAILWDIDGTLLNFHKAERRSITECFLSIGVKQVTEEFLNRYKALNRRYWNMLELGQISRERLLTERFIEFCSIENIPLEDAAALNRQYQEGLARYIYPNDNSLELIAELSGRVKQYAVTNGTAHAQRGKLKNSGLDKLFDGIFISEEVGADKPDARFFEAVFAAIPFKKEECVVVGDSLTSDIKGANGFGIPAILYDPEGRPDASGYELMATIKDVNEIKNYL